MNRMRWGWLILSALTAAAQPHEAFDLNEHGLQAWQRGDYVEAER